MAFWDIGGIVSGIGRLWGSIFGSKETTEKDISREKTTAQQIAVAEAMATSRRTDFFTAFVEGLNRLIRPTFSYGVVAYFVWATVDPVGFTVSMQALALIPTPMYGIFLTIVGFWFGGRIFEKYADAKLQGPSASQLQEVLDNQKKILAGHGGSVIVNKTIDVPNEKPKPAPAPAAVRHNVTMEPIYEDDEKKPDSK